MRVLVIHTYYKLKGGEDSVVANEIELLRANGITVDLLSFYNTGSTLKKLLQLPFNRSSYRQTKERIASFQPDVVHIHNLHFSGSAAVIYAAKKCKVPVVMTLHNYRLLCPSGTLYHKDSLFLDSLEKGFPWKAVEDGVYQNSLPITFWVSLSMYLHEKLGTWKAVDKFILLGEHSRELLLSSRMAAHASRTVIKPNFCYALPDSESTDEDPYYLYIGRLTNEKGVPVLLNSFAANKLDLKIIGTGPLQDMVKSYAIKYPNIEYMGEQPKETVYQMLENATALIFPSVWYETFGMVVIEAFSKGIPVIASDLGNIRHLVEHEFNGLTFAAGDSRDLCDKIRRFETLPEYIRQNYRKNARASYTEKYNPEHNAAQLVSIYNSLEVLTRNGD